MVNRLVIFAIILISSGCTKKSFDSADPLWTYLKNPDNGYHFTNNVNGTLYTLTYRPTDLLVTQEVNPNATKIQIDSAREKYGSNMYFDLSISADGQELLNKMVNDKQAFGELVGELSFGMADKIHLIGQNRDTLELVDYTYPRLYGLSNNTKMLLVFHREKELLSQDYFLLTIEGLGFQTGEVSFKIDTHKIVKEPSLTFKN